ncbi:MAG: flagellin FliC [Gammaproteobacteria bacterium]|nr:flagellin FliC [Gammaproteobacteria bacterium]MBU1602881.1 flagellin FliC [Gammaproteobacteria bacterium]MBU2432553.1 flagellin FliC [Gammaproteobacteria bacterium]MBU2448904.1 flagellin FliC [Gammaproteobacteria bacterium]
MAQINTNNYSLNAQKNLAKNSLGLSSALERLSSGLRVNSAKDDASGLASGVQINAAARITNVKIRALGDDISSAQIADGALAVVGDIMSRIIELNNGTNSAATSAERNLLSAQATTVQTEANAAIAVFGGTTFTSVAVAGTENASSSLQTVTNARITQGATINNAQFAIQAKQAAYENQKAAESRIMDADFAQETSNLSRFQILQQAGTAMVAQANAIPQNVLTLLR